MQRSLEPPDDAGQGGPPAAPSDTLLAALSLALTGALDERLRLEQLAACLVPALAEWCLVELADPDGPPRLAALGATTPELAASLGALRERHPPAWAGPPPIDQPLTLRAPDAPSHEGMPGVLELAYGPILAALGCPAALAIPMATHKRPLGLILLGSSAGPLPLGEDNARAAEIGRRAAMAVENARLFAEERAARAEAEAAIHARDELAALVAHDLRNPLTVVHGQSDALLRHMQRPELDRERLVRGLEAIKAAAGQMRFLLDDLHDGALVRGGQPLRLELEPTELVALARRAAAAQQAGAARHQVRVETALEELWCACDARRVERVLASLLGNAVKFSPGGGPVTLTVGREERGARAWAALSVADQGVGIPEEDLPRIFAPFHRARNVARSVRGTGFGLTSVHAIVTQHGGDITVDSAEGGGSTFTVRLPLEHE